MPLTNEDPLDWTVDEVVKFLCRNPETPWSNSKSKIPRPDPSSFETSLRDNFITGEVLLQDVDKEALRDDLGLKALGHRSSMMLAIRFLQQRSQKFQASQTPVLSSPTPLRLLSPPPPSVPPKPTSTKQSPTQHSSAVISASLKPSTPNRPLTLAATQCNSSPGNGVESPGTTARDRSDVRARTSPQKPVDEQSIQGDRSHKQIVVGDNGRKRRRLNLTSPVEAQGEISTPQEHGEVAAEHWYMGPSALTAENVFYPSAPEEGDQEFTLMPSNIPTAQRTFVNNSLKYFFQQSPIELSSDQKNYQRAVVPYKISGEESKNSRFFSLYTNKQGVVRYSKEDIKNWPQLRRQLKMKNEASTTGESLKPSDPFAYLLEKYPVGEDSADAFPLYGDSGSEGEFDEETWREMENERSEPVPPLQQRKLPIAVINAIISDCISEYQDLWLGTRLPKEEYKARRIWLAARRQNSTNQEIKAMTREISLLHSRLQKLQDELRKVEYATQEELRTQCQCLEQTVFEIQKQKWRISVLEQQSCPAKVARPLQPQHRPKAQVDDEESLNSESDVMEDDSLDEFIDDSEVPRLHQDIDFPVSPSSDGDDDVISVSGTRRRTRGRAPRVFVSSSPSLSPSSPVLIPEKPNIIDLTLESPEPEDLEIETPPLNPVGATKFKHLDSISPRLGTSMSPPPSIGSAEGSVQVKREYPLHPSIPDIDDMDGILLVEWELLEERQDRRRLLAKIIGALSDKERSDLADRIPQYQFSQIRRLVKRALHSLSKKSREIPDMGVFETNIIMRTAAAYVSWVNCVRLAHAGIKKHDVKTALEDLDYKEGRGFDTYYEELIKRLETCQDWKREGGVSGPEHEQDLADTPHRKRKREVKESQQAKINQENAQTRMARQAKQKKKLEKRLEIMGVSNDNFSHQAVSFKDPVIYLNSHIGRRVKPHQLDGIQFMWRELIEDKNGEGCLLAHTMGLGKTMQVISLLTTIFEGASSSDPKVRQQIPEPFRRPQILILCPSSLIDNWSDEFSMWSPELAPMLRRVVATDHLLARLEEVSAWYQEGGVLLISYNIFQSWIINKGTEKRAKPLSDAEHERVKRWLLEGPSIIIADEAHKMKNPSSGASLAAMKFKSKSRIALTGSPLANNLKDYYTMVNWIAEGFLGNHVEFKAHYIEPIEEGLYAESSYYERRKSLMKLQVLKQILEPKINRADITVLEGDLPPKVEFLLTVPLTKLQKSAYDSYAAFVLRGQKGDIGEAQLWSWLGILGLCCNHPACFWEKMINRAEDEAKIAKKMSGGNQVIPGDEPIDKAQIPDLETLVADQEHIFRQVPDLRAVELSARAQIARKIIDESIAIGDKVLVFSQSLPTLDYLEYLLKVSNRRYLRLDGSTPIASRQSSTKQFNSGDGKQVYLISTRAGGLGLNIPGANRVIIFDFSFSPIWEEQAVGRAYRLGQRKPVFVYRFLAGGTFEEIIHHKATFKTQLSVRVVDKKNPIRSARKKPGDYLFPAKPVAQKDISEYIGKDKQVLDKILREDEGKREEDRLIRDIMLTQTFMADVNDNLTEEEKRSVQQEFDDENLRRTDPVAYQKRLSEKQMQLMQQQHQALSAEPFPISVAHGVYHPSRPMNGNGVYPVHQHPQPSFSKIAHNSGPPALAPETIASLSAHTAHRQTPLFDVNNLAQKPKKTQAPPQKLQSEGLAGQAQPNNPTNVISRQAQAAPAGQYPAIPGIVSRGPASPPMGTFDTGHGPRSSSNNRVDSEPLKPNSPIVNTFRPKVVTNHQQTSPRGQSAPIQPQDSASKLPEVVQEPSAAAEPQQPISDGEQSSAPEPEEVQAGNGCRQQ
ncbi:putative SNF2 family helicase/ATPase [Aspergillus stella-maris]|uniref:putative SNF2 family helicase/ATPase n=1 Tax=Aspergillus stella-maris TaxID=1810926 RepID=UPI003CCD0856